MLAPEELKRYNRHIILPGIGPEGQEKLKKARVLVIGAGGLGCPVLQYLAAAGTGTIGIIDPDVVDETNLHRQILFNPADAGRKKPEVAAEKLRNQNPYIHFEVFAHALEVENALELISRFDIIVDGTDNFATRYLVNDACIVSGKPLVSGSIYKFEGQVSVFNYKGGPTYRCLYPEPGNAPSCAEVGVLGVLPGVIGTIMASEVIKVITGVGEVLSGRLLVADLLSMQFNEFSFPLQPLNRQIQFPGRYDFHCAGRVNEISADRLKELIAEKAQFQLIDVREFSEYDQKNIGGELIPLKELESNLHRIAKDRPVIIHCQTGLRSRKAAELLVEKGFENVSTLKDGLKDF